jgi:hypothetical protein
MKTEAALDLELQKWLQKSRAERCGAPAFPEDKMKYADIQKLHDDGLVTNEQRQKIIERFQLKQECFLDIIPAGCNYATNQADLVGFSMFPGHLLVHASQLEPELKLAFFNFDWLQKFLDKNPKALAHHTEGKDDKGMLLTADTRDLQKFVLKHLGEGELFDKPGEMIRRTNSVPAASSGSTQRVQ